ncbi:hypothetical protein ABTX61_39740, partial [Amycolatopsis japonica]|uniref:hypothetical protein n=1 Tax=Amycolatopsis japonica TaxID=208439 RepID=UPI0033329AB6
MRKWLSQRLLLPSPAKPATITSAPTRSVAKAEPAGEVRGDRFVAISGMDERLDPHHVHWIR